MNAVEATWVDSDVAAADIVLCAHVIDGEDDPQRFIEKLCSHTTKQVLMLESMESPMSAFSKIWEDVHGEKRVDLPGLPELLNVLWSMGIHANVEMFDPTPPSPAGSAQAAQQLLRGLLFVAPDSAQDERLTKAIADNVMETSDGFALAGSRPRRRALVSWNVPK